MMSAYSNLYKFCLGKGILLCGVVEDSRDDLLCKNLKGLPASNSRDTAVLFDSLEPGERTFAVSHPGSSQLGGLAKNVFSFYLKPAEFDRPIKVDFLAPEGRISETAERIAEIVYNTSRFNRSYGIPTVTIEADARAKLREEDLDALFQEISDRAGPTPLSLALRRRNRPF